MRDMVRKICMLAVGYPVAPRFYKAYQKLRIGQPFYTSFKTGNVLINGSSGDWLIANDFAIRNDCKKRTRIQQHTIMRLKGAATILCGARRCYSAEACNE